MPERRYSAPAVLITIASVLCAALWMSDMTGNSSVVSAHEDKKLAGAELFASSGCTHCHGADGTGTDDGPSLRTLRKRLKPEQIAEQIRHGGKEMPAFGDSLNEEQIASLVAFLDAKTWKAAPAASPPRTTTAPPAPTPAPTAP